MPLHVNQIVLNYYILKFTAKRGYLLIFKGIN